MCGEYIEEIEDTKKKHIIGYRQGKIGDRKLHRYLKSKERRERGL